LNGMSSISGTLGAARGVCAVLGAVLFGLCVGAPAAQASQSMRMFGYTGTEQSFTVPAGVTSISVQAVGGAGASGDGASGGVGGVGAIVTGDLAVTPGETLYVEVGGDGSGDAGGFAGGFNGGGVGGNNGQTESFAVGAGGGGGASDVRTCSVSASCAGGTLSSRLIVAGGGGGGGEDVHGSSGAATGGSGGAADAAGSNGTTTAAGAGGGGGGVGTSPGGAAGQGGAGMVNDEPGAMGALGVGGAGGSDPECASGAGGGGGVYGGGGGGGDDGCGTNLATGGGGGGGGSSLVPPGGSASPNSGQLDDPSITITYTPAFALTVTRAGSGAGKVTSSPAGISCGAGCKHYFPSGTAVTLTAKAASGSRFAGWSGACTGTGTCKLTMNAGKRVTATFAAIPPPNTTITGAFVDTGKHKATLDFTDSGGVGALHSQCKLDSGSWQSCTSPKTYTGLAHGSHTFEVRAIDSRGQADPTPAKHSFTI
jgi:hypothetical protein